MGKVAAGTCGICSFQIVLAVSIWSANLFFAQSCPSSQTDLCHLHFKISLSFHFTILYIFASDSENKFCFHPYCFFGSHFTFHSAECCRVWVKENEIIVHNKCFLIIIFLICGRHYVLTDNILQPFLFLWSLILKLVKGVASFIQQIFYLYSNIYVVLAHLIPTYVHISDYLKNGRKKKFEKSYRRI